MGRQIIKQPNGKYCIWSSMVDDVIWMHMEEEDIIDEWAKEARHEIEKKVKAAISSLNKGEKPYHQFTKSFDDAIKRIKEIHGEKMANERKKEMEQ